MYSLIPILPILIIPNLSLMPFHGDDYIHPSLELANIPGKGRGLIVNTNIPVGTVLIKERPLYNYASLQHLEPDTWLPFMTEIQQAKQQNARIADFIENELISPEELVQFFLDNKIPSYAVEKELKKINSKLGLNIDKNEFFRYVAMSGANDYHSKVYGWFSKINHDKYPNIEFAGTDFADSQEQQQLEDPIKVAITSKDIQAGEEINVYYGSYQLPVFHLLRNQSDPKQYESSAGAVSEGVVNAVQKVLRVQLENNKRNSKIHVQISLCDANNYLDNDELYNIWNIIDHVVHPQQTINLLGPVDENLQMSALNSHIKYRIMEIAPQNVLGLMDYLYVGNDPYRMKMLLQDNGIKKFQQAAVGEIECSEWMRKLDARFCEWVDKMKRGKELMESAEMTDNDRLKIMMMNHAINMCPLMTEWRLQRARLYKRLYKDGLQEIERKRNLIEEYKDQWIADMQFIDDTQVV